MSGVNKAILLGRLGKDPELRFTQYGKSMCSFSLATSERWGDEERTEWHRIVMFDRLAETANQYLRKGDQVYLEGKIQTRSWNDKAGARHYQTEIVAGFMQMLGGPRRQGAPEATKPAEAQEPAFLQKLPDDQLPDGQLPDGQLPDGQLPDGQLPDGDAQAMSPSVHPGTGASPPASDGLQGRPSAGHGGPGDHHAADRGSQGPPPAGHGGPGGPPASPGGLHGPRPRPSGTGIHGGPSAHGPQIPPHVSPAPGSPPTGGLYPRAQSQAQGQAQGKEEDGLPDDDFPYDDDMPF
ncbi:MAG: single-stranded DNA-binding protein [Deltaproteobacteria bacterium]|jgi:single-strand DNA-binding protein|nr:single-stranded DNA-binding protein [Deltaproteobacteria bacterium]